MRGRRDQVFVATKLSTDTREEAQPLFERSLERLGTDYVDVLHMHSAGQRNLDVALSKDGVWPYIMEQKKAGRARFCGITGHKQPDQFRQGPRKRRNRRPDVFDELCRSPYLFV